MYREVASGDLSPDEFRAAELGFHQLLRRKRMSPSFIERHAEDLLAQALFEYTRRAATGVEIHDPPAWIVTCAWNRTKSLLETRDYRPQLVSTDSVAEPVDEAPGPADVLLDEDRTRKIREAVAELPLYQRNLLALSYFEGESVRDAGRRLGWTASKAQRAHEAAQRRIAALLDVDSLDELEVPIGLFAFLSFCADRASGHSFPAGAEAVLDSTRRAASDLGHGAGTLLHRPLEAVGGLSRSAGRRGGGAIEATHGGGRRGMLTRVGDLGRRITFGGAGEGGAAVAGEGGGRMVEVCKGLAVCALGGGVLTSALVGGSPMPSPHPSQRRPMAVEAGTRRRHRQAPLRSTQPTVSVSVPRPRPGTDTAGSSTSTAPRSKRTATRSPEVEQATPVARSGAAAEAVHAAESEEAVETQFQNFAATEGTGGGDATRTSAVTDSSTRTSSSSTPGGSSSGKTTAEEAQTARQFQGPLAE